LSVTDAEGLPAHGRQMIALSKRRRDVRFIDTLRTLPRGKIEKFELRALQFEEQGSRA
jgi:acyl-CoA synthetase (AMP-forming)/AMP-acid ligase II